MYEFDFGGECDLMNFDVNMGNLIQQEFESREILDIFDLDKLSSGNQVNGAENQSNKIDPQDFSICSQLNACSPSRNAQEDYNFRFLHPKCDMIDPPWKRENNFADNANNKLSEFVANNTYSASTLGYPNVIQNQEGTVSSGNTNISQNYVPHWNHELSRTDFVPEISTNARKIFNILETNDASRKTVLDSTNGNIYNGSCNPSRQSILETNDASRKIIPDSANSNIYSAPCISNRQNILETNDASRKIVLDSTNSNIYNAPCNPSRQSILETSDASRKIILDSANTNIYNAPCIPSRQSIKNIENICVLQNKPRSITENEQENAEKKNVVRIVLHRRKDTQAPNKNAETVERYQVVLPAGRKSRDSLQTFKIQKEDTYKGKIISESGNDTERVQKLDGTPGIKRLNFNCQICGEKLATRYSLITHMKSHRQPFCSSCIIVCKSREQLRQHMNRLHMAPRAPEVTVVTSKYGRKRQVFCPLSLMTRRRSVNKRMAF